MFQYILLKYLKDNTRKIRIHEIQKIEITKP